MSFIFKKIVTNEKINFWNFTNFFTVGVGVVFFIILKYFKQLLPSNKFGEGSSFGQNFFGQT